MPNVREDEGFTLEIEDLDDVDVERPLEHSEIVSANRHEIVIDPS